MWGRFYFIWFLSNGRRNTQLGLVFGGHCEWAVRALFLLVLLYSQPTLLKPILHNSSSHSRSSCRRSFNSKSWTRSVSSAFFASALAHTSNASVQDSLKVQSRDWDLVRPLWSAGGLPEKLQAPRPRPCERWNVPAADAAALLLLPLLVWLALLLLLKLLLSLTPPISALLEGADGAEGLP